MSLCFQFLQSEQSDDEVDSNEGKEIVADDCSIGDIMRKYEKKAERLEAYIKNQYVRTIVRVIKFIILYQNGEINCLHNVFLIIYAFFTLQISKDKANCGIYSTLAKYKVCLMITVKNLSEDGWQLIYCNIETSTL